MASDDAELSSITTALDELRHRITGLAERNARANDETLAQALFDVERTLGEALRRLARLAQAT
jgi:predicted transcriptional regulator